MAGWSVRDFAPDDLEAMVRLEVESDTGGHRPAFSLADVVAALQAHHPAVVAVADGHLVGAAVSRVDGDRAWVLRVSLHSAWRNLGLGSALVSALEHRLGSSGTRTLAAILPDEGTGATALRNSGFRPWEGMTYFEKARAVTAQDVVLLSGLGAVVPEAGLWRQLAGMAAEKRLIERRLVLPLAHPELATQHGVEPPQAVVLFGPPGTGKSTFAKAVAGRLGWPFVELFPSRLALEGGLATGLSDRFAEIGQLDHVLVFIDEVEEVAALRSDADPVSVGVVNELLKLIVRFRDRDSRLLVCATNNVAALDPAFLRHGRFDHVLPIGPPDPEARRGLWSSYLARADAEADAAALADASDGFTPADIAHVARTVAQDVFERTLDTGVRAHPSTEDYLDAISRTRPTVTDEMAREFAAHTDRYART
ncbi:GNAT family N-acetyltransferase [Streptomyces sp. H10-C2]|uniref:ATP-binding protein n=1 Tax=unclassified Streptomyces TaxID=2593676 RepID=UPI0024BB21AE|nr:MULTISPECIES: GNAT family N-acetyltransferase [unclassified Streptomyces]MDJ0346491.1 GNAT family N-acetyltransferase [Streptomyces sp. PH10-H1]MDJ0374975.1 GNAT family N-acetyltransferase [Streptomyces sp. H10-C2]